MPDKSDHSASSSRKRRHGKRERSRSPFTEDEHRPKEKRASRRQPDPDSDVDVPAATGSTSGKSGEISLSISQTNALRAKLGLAPLEVDEDGSGADDSRIVDNQSENYVHVPAKDMRKIRETEALKDKLNTHKDKRMLHEKFSQSHLYEPVEEKTSVESWVEKLREKERIKKQAQERAKLLSEMDDQLDNMNEPIEIPGSNQYGATSLSGLKVQHHSDQFREGKTVILTLQDRDVLDDTESTDLLVNVNMVDDDKAEQNRENLRKTAGLAGIADHEDEAVLLGLKQKSILSKYDGELEGQSGRSKHFVLGEDGTYIPEAENALHRLTAELRAGRQSLPDTELRPVSDYYSAEEIQAKFKSRKRRIKVRTRTGLTADDLTDSTLSSQPSGGDLGSRSRSGHHHEEEAQVQPKPEDGELSEIDNHSLDLIGSPLVADLSDDMLHGPPEEDVFRDEIERAINRVINVKSRAPIKPEEAAARLLAYKPEQSDEQTVSSASSSNAVVFDSTAEFYKSIGSGLQATMREHARLSQLMENEVEPIKFDDIKPTKPEEWGMAKGDINLSKISSSEDEDYSDAPSSAYRQKPVSSASSSKRRTGMTDGSTAPTQMDKEMKNKVQLGGVLDDEPCLDTGIFSALELAQKKGYLEKGKEKRVGTGTMVNLMAKHFVQEDVRYDDIDSKFAKRERYNGPLSDFKELKTFTPDVKLEYVDELGRQLNSKEAFRQLSHKFHGKGSGKNKTDKRIRKIKEEFLLAASTSSDTPLGTVEKLNKKLQSISLPYVILSGKNAAAKHLAK